MNIKRPLKAPTDSILDLASLQPWLDEYGYLYASDKEDGIRCITHPKLGPVSQKLLSIPNHWVRALLDADCLSELDGELVAIDCEGNPADFNDTQSAIMTQEGTPRFEFRVFDCFNNPFDQYVTRLMRAAKQVRYAQKAGLDHIKLLPQYVCRTVAELEKREASALRRGKEGIMLRSPIGVYKEGRSTLSEAYLLKVKRFVDDEAVVIGYEEEYENCNPATRDAGGLQKRSKHQAGLKGKGMIGKLICVWQEKEIRIGSGLTHEQKQHWWDEPRRIVGKTITFKYQKHGMKDLPRAPIFKGIRHD